MVFMELLQSGRIPENSLLKLPVGSGYWMTAYVNLALARQGMCSIR